MTFTAKLELDGLQINLQTSIAMWVSSVSNELVPLAAQVLADCEAAGIATSNSSFRIPNDLAAAWPEQIALQAKLPAAMPFPLDLRLSAGLGQQGTIISTRWMKV